MKVLRTLNGAFNSSLAPCFENLLEGEPLPLPPFATVLISNINTNISTYLSTHTERPNQLFTNIYKHHLNDLVLNNIWIIFALNLDNFYNCSEKKTFGLSSL